MTFLVSIDRDEDGIWVVNCPAIPGRDQRPGHRQRPGRHPGVLGGACGAGNAADGRDAASGGDCLMAHLPVLSARDSRSNPAVDV